VFSGSMRLLVMHKYVSALIHPHMLMLYLVRICTYVNSTQNSLKNHDCASMQLS
jgi:hypothetical protein